IADPKVLHPSDMVIDHQSNLYIADYEVNGDSFAPRLQKFDKTGRLLAKWDSSSTPKFGDDILELAVDAQDNLYVSGALANQIWKIDPTGKPLTKWGSAGVGDGQFKGAQGIAVDNQGNVYVADNQGDRVEKFDSNGKFLGKWGSTGVGD